MSHTKLFSVHAMERKNQRKIKLDEGLTIDKVLKMPIYKKDRGCIMYLDVKNNIVYYVRDNVIVTMINTNPIQMLRYYLIGKNEDHKFNCYCRDNLFNRCSYGDRCKYKHIDYD